MAVCVMLRYPPEGFTYTKTELPKGLAATVFPLIATALAFTQQPPVFVSVASCTHDRPLGDGLDASRSAGLPPSRTKTRAKEKQEKSNYRVARTNGNTS
jgi:hypothetical protein